MRRQTASALLTLVAALAGGSWTLPLSARPERPQMRFASPGRIVASDVAMSQLAQRKGQWAALRERAADDAVLFVPQPVPARDWLKSQSAAIGAAWQPHQVVLSCDGSLAVSSGAWQRSDGTSGRYATVWQRQSKGDYAWLMTHSEAVATPLPAKDMIASQVAYCDPAARRQAAREATKSAGPSAASPAPALPAGTRGGWSDDRTLSWSVAADAACAQTLTINLLPAAGEAMRAVLAWRLDQAGDAARCAPR